MIIQNVTIKMLKLLDILKAIIIIILAVTMRMIILNISIRMVILFVTIMIMLTTSVKMSTMLCPRVLSTDKKVQFIVECG